VEDLEDPSSYSYSYDGWVFKSSLLAGNDIGEAVLYIGCAINSLFFLLLLIDATAFYFEIQSQLSRLR